MASHDAGSRIVKRKETASLLMSIIRTITTSEDVVSREREKAKLEKEYKDSDKKLDALVTEHQTDLTSIIQAFSNISRNITDSQEKIRAIKDNLQSCKNLLHCKRDELRKLWIEGITHRTTVDMLDKIDEISNVSDKLQEFIDKKHYLHATDLLIKSVSLLEGDLKYVEALRDVRMELRSKKDELFEKLVDELHKQIYVKPMSSVIKGFQRQGSARTSRGRSEKDKYLKMALLQSSKSDGPEISSSEMNLHKMMEVKLEEVSQAQTVVEDIHVSEPDSDPVHFISILVQSLAILKKMPDAIDTLRGQIRPGLLAIVLRASQQIADNAYVEGDNLASMHQPQLLLELLELIFLQFRVVARIHQIVIANMQRVKVTSAHLGDFCIYNTSEVWVKIQAVLQLVLSDYLDVRNTAASQNEGHGNFEEPVTEIAQHFTKKRPGKIKKTAMFRFDASSHAISMSSYLREQRQEFYGSGDLLSGSHGVSADENKAEFVTKPCASNITVIYNPLQKFIKEIEAATLSVPGTLTLQDFVTEFIKNIYLGQVMYNINTNISQATKGFDAQRFLVNLHIQRELGVKKPLLQSTVSVARSLHELQELMSNLPCYADQFLSMICRILGDYYETCQASYRGLVMPEGDDRRIISANWAKDEDIGRFIRSLPSWAHLKEEHPEIDEDDLRAMNSKESQILTSNLSSSDALIPPQEIITDTLQLMTLANMVESLEWFCNEILQLVGNLEAHNKRQLALPALTEVSTSAKVDTTPKLPTIGENTLLTLRSLSKDFTSLSELCLLVLHLEVRVHCFYHLLPIAKQSNYNGGIDDMDPDSHIIRLNKDLTNIEVRMNEALQPPKFHYIFEGLGHLVASILINSTQYLERINENGIKKMCRNCFAVQHCLTNITQNRESDLDRAKQYYELLYSPPDEIIKIIVERRPMFSEQEYTNLLALAHRSKRGAKEQELTAVLRKLEEVLKEYGALV